MIIETRVVGPVDCNCSVAVCPATSEAIIVDPGGNEEELVELVRSLGAKIKFILITHAHFDHVIAARRIRELTGAPICLHAKDKWLYRIMPIQYLAWKIDAKKPLRINRWLKDGENLTFGEYSLAVMHTPGHSPGSVCFHMPDQKLLFSGDTLFRESFGNPALPFANLEAVIDSVLNKLLVLPDETRVLPGHGEETSIGHEKIHNPLVREGVIEKLREEARNKPSTMKMMGQLLLYMIKGK